MDRDIDTGRQRHRESETETQTQGDRDTTETWRVRDTDTGRQSHDRDMESQRQRHRDNEGRNRWNRRRRRRGGSVSADKRRSTDLCFTAKSDNFSSVNFTLGNVSCCLLGKERLWKSPLGIEGTGAPDERVLLNVPECMQISESWGDSSC